ncbi:histidine protein methyltransferase 1 homolog [Tribolium castaneum]|uniref:protein-histidine N-methyltransferase n=1 Tax=Tribolium castaneum TaxID=7070 RepID=D6X186_TRICA|nr:PREDICTED: histidine protein methyltransferase 1 homolog [Tribolium castaneum]EFA10806.2 Histidine protein methyltransferase 1 homolog-like Protein [Tribolium castaneum]|eukprot:XP_008198493.1 PREDICTED: histidine protein methyltransferase 1 homolog [Tribolium castaneum]
MFKFGFSSDDPQEKTAVSTEQGLNWLESYQIRPENVTITGLSPNSCLCGEFDVKFVSNRDVLSVLEQGGTNSLLSAEKNHSDLIPAVYEGGLKVWECTFDLVDFLVEQKIDFGGKDVLDLGCGAGIAGILACLKGARTVFQDYNIEVIESLTIPNVYLNGLDLANCAFFCGDWGSFLDLQLKSAARKYDFILTSETIYNTNNYKKILSIFKQLLKPTGMIFLAAKYHYFGVGGGIPQFEDLLKMEDVFTHTICWQNSSGVKRAIIKISFKN